MTLTSAAPSSRVATESDAKSRARGLRTARVLGAVGRVFMGTGVLLALFAAYQVWGTGIQEARAQTSLRADFDDRLVTAQARLADVIVSPSIDTTTDTTDSTDSGTETTTDAEVDIGSGVISGVEEAAGAEVDPEVLALFFPENGEAVARIEIPAISSDKVVVSGVQVSDLRRGPGHYSSTSRPGNSGNSSIAGHRTTYGAPFSRIDELEPGDEITVTTVQGQFVYRVLDPNDAYADILEDGGEVGSGHIIVDPSATWVLGDFGDNRLTLTACHPKFSARKRIIVTAELVGDPADLPPAIEEAMGFVAPPEIPGEVIDDAVAADDDPTATGDTADDAAQDVFSPVISASAGDDNLDEGLNGERDAIPRAAGWLIGALALWLLGSRFARRRPHDLLGRVAIRSTVAIPTIICLWFCFEAADRALPAY